MAEYIERERAIQKVKNVMATEWFRGNYEAIGPLQRVVDVQLGRMTAADVAPVVHGHWTEKKPSGGGGIWDCYFVCSVCGGNTPNKAYVIAPDFCPNCGAKMDGKERQNNE